MNPKVFLSSLLLQPGLQKTQFTIGVKMLFHKQKVEKNNNFRYNPSMHVDLILSYSYSIIKL